MQIKVGSRSSALAKIQSQSGAQELFLPVAKWVNWQMVYFSSPGDRDLKTDLTIAAPDFFTADLDRALLENQIDCAIHSAKDLPAVLNERLDYFCLPTQEDPRDCLVYHQQCDTPRIGVSSARRQLWAQKQFPHAIFLPIRGSIESRLEQLDAGAFDMVIMAVAALNRLGLQYRISQIIQLDEMSVPDGQGRLAVVYEKSNAFFNRLRTFFTSPVVFAGAGNGMAENLTLGVLEALKRSTVVLYDALGGESLLHFCSAKAQKISVGKRLNAHSMPQSEIGNLILHYVKLGEKVVRLKGGDAGIFGRLAEEVNLLEDAHLDYEVQCGVSSFVVATTGTGLLPTRRGVARGFEILTPRVAKSGVCTVVESSEKGKIYFMGVSESRAILSNLSDQKIPASVVFDAGKPTQKILSGKVSDLSSKIEAFYQTLTKEEKPAGLLLVGAAFDEHFLYKKQGLLAGQKIGITCSADLAERVIEAVRQFGGEAVLMSMIELRVKMVDLKKFLDADYWVITSPTVARMVCEACLTQRIDFRKIPKIVSCGSGTSRTFSEHGIQVDFQPETDFGNKGILKLLCTLIKQDDKVVRFKSNLASEAIANLLSPIAIYQEVEMAENTTIAQQALLPCDAYFFGSSSAVRTFVTQYGVHALEGRAIIAIGEPTCRCCAESFNRPEESIFVGDIFTAKSAISQYAASQILLTSI